MMLRSGSLTRVLELGPTTIATIYENIVRVLLAKGDYDGAPVQFEKSLAVRESVVDKDYPATATSYSNLDVVLDKQGGLRRST
jgi:hypothetical protein